MGETVSLPVSSSGIATGIGLVLAIACVFPYWAQYDFGIGTNYFTVLDVSTVWYLIGTLSIAGSLIPIYGSWSFIAQLSLRVMAMLSFLFLVYRSVSVTSTQSEAGILMGTFVGLATVITLGLASLLTFYESSISLEFAGERTEA